MNRSHYEKAKAIFLAACDRPEEERRAYVVEACGSDGGLREAVDALLVHDGGDDLRPPSPPVEEEADAAPFCSPGDVLADRYRVVARLGRGGMGEVYHAIDLTLDVPVALKFPRVSGAAHQVQLLDEVRLARSVTHPAVARIYDLGTLHGQHFVSMEYVPGDDLGRLLARVGRLPAERVAEIGHSLCQGLAAAHEAGVLHRDVKPSNILIDPAGAPKLIDFGIAMSLDARSAALAGTPSYMAPEQLRGDALTQRTDLWSLGAVLYQMCTGRKPFEGTTLEAVRAAQGAPLAPPSALGLAIDDRLEAALMAALAVAPADRPPSASALAARLDGSGARRREVVSRGVAVTPSEPERRPLTVLHCELDDPDGRIEALDPEDLQRFSDVARREFERVAARYEASLAEHEELEATIRFGFPVAHEDGAVRAILAGLELADRLETRLEALDAFYGTRARVRQGVHAGSAVVETASSATARPRLTGNVFRVARRLAQRAAPGDLVASREVRRLVGDRFETHPRDPADRDGPHVVLGPSERPERPAEAISTDVPFVGREVELALVLERVRRAASGRGQVLLASGDGGVGKSRLLRELRRRLASEPLEWRSIHCSSYLRGAAFQPLVDAIRSELGLDAADGVDEVEGDDAAAGRFERGAASRELSDSARRLLVELAALPFEASNVSIDSSLRADRDQVIDALCRWFIGSADDRPVVLVLEDLHWADPSTVDFLEALCDRVAGEAAIVIATHRPEWSPAWPPRSHSTSIGLSPLTEEESAELVRQAGSAELGHDAIARIVGRADGIPLFAEELARHASSADTIGVPETLRDTLVSRLDRMAAAKPIAQCAAVLGRDFDPDVLVSIGGRPREEVMAALEALVREDVLVRTRRGDSTRFAFRHALLRDAAYSSLVRERRVALHAQALDVLRKDPRTVEHAPEILALHAEFAGREPLILEFRQRAAQRAADRLAPREAITHATRALEALSWQPSGRERDERELAIQSLLAVSLLATEGFGSSVTEQVFERARALCAEVGDASQQAPILYGIFSFHEARAESKCLDVADGMAERAAAAGDRLLRNLAESNRGRFRLWNGEIDACRDILRRVWQAEDRSLQRSLAFRFGDEPLVCSLATLACAECALGDTATGRRTLSEAVDLAERLDHPMTLAAVLGFSALAAQLLDDVELCAELVGRNERVCAEGRFPNWSAATLAQRGWIDMRRGEPAIGISKVESAIGRCATIGQRVYVQAMQVFLSEGELAVGRVDAAMAAADAAIALADETDDRLWLSEAHRLRGDSLDALGRGAESEASYRRGVEVARAQGTALLEIRAAQPLALRLSERGGGSEARALLDGALSRASGFEDAADVRAARALRETC